jgi:uncharacterized protein (DUF1330 family)
LMKDNMVRHWGSQRVIRKSNEKQIENNFRGRHVLVSLPDH